MKQRNRKSVLLDSEKVSHTMNGIASPKKHDIKKSRKQGSTDWSPRPSVYGPITKDEAEIVETLYALAGMVPGKCLNNKSELVGESLPENSSVLPELEEGAAQDANPSFAERSPEEATKTSSLSVTVDHEQPDLPEGANNLVASDSIASKMNQQNMPTLVRREDTRKVVLPDLELCLAIGLNRSRQSPNAHKRGPETALEKAMGNDESKQEQHMIKDPIKNGILHEGSALWPGLSPVASSGNHASYSKCSAANDPVWLDAAICTPEQDLVKSNSAGGKISEVVTHKRPWKRCAAHVQIGHLIQSLQVPNNEMWLQQPNQSNQGQAHDGSKHGALMEVNDLKGIMNNEITSAPVRGHSASTKNYHEKKNGILQRRYHEKSQAALTPGLCVPQKQNFNFLSLSAGWSGLEVTNSSNKVGGRLEPFSKLPVPHLHSLAQHHDRLMPLPTPQSRRAPTFYLDRPCITAPQVKSWVPYYSSSPSSGTHSNWTAPKKQEHQNQCFWAVQVVGGGRPSWQSRRRETPAVSSCPQVILPHSTTSLEALGSKIIPISGYQQHQLNALSSSLPQSRTNGLHLRPPSVCEECRGSFRSTNVTPSL